METGHRILVVDDDEGVRAGVAAVLSACGYEVAEAVDGITALDVVRRFLPHLVVLEVGLPGRMDGLVVARRLSFGGTPPLILFLTAAAEVPDELAGFSAGGDEYLRKPFEHPVLVARVRALLRRTETADDPSRVVIGDLVVEEAAGRASLSGREVAVTPTEFRLLSELARHAGQVLSRTQLAELLWHAEYDANAVERHVSSLRRKLLAQHFSGLITVRGLGYRLEAE